MNFLKFPVEENIHKKLSSLFCSDFYGKIYIMKNHYPVQVTSKDVFFTLDAGTFPYDVSLYQYFLMLEAGRFTLGAGFSRFGFHIGCYDIIGGVLCHVWGLTFHVWVWLFALAPFTLGAFHILFLTDVLVDLDEGQGSGSSEHETTTESSMLPTTTIGI